MKIRSFIRLGVLGVIFALTTPHGNSAPYNGTLSTPEGVNIYAQGIKTAWADKTGFNYINFPFSPAPRKTTVFIGGANKFYMIANDVAQSIASNKIALYEHATGLAALTIPQRQAIQNAWSSTGSQIVKGGGTAMGEIGQGFGPNNVANFGGAFPAIDTVNINDSGETYTATSTDAVPGKVYQHYISADYVTQAQASFAATMNGTGAKLLLPFIPIWINTDDMFSVGGYWANARNLAISAGGIALDFPSNDAIMNGDGFINSMADAIKWAVANHLAAVLTLSPYTATGGNCDYQANLLSTSQLAVAQLRIRGAIPTSYVIENYCQNGDDSTVNTAAGDSVQGSLNQTALWLAAQPTSPFGTMTSPVGASETTIHAIFDGTTVGNLISEQLSIKDIIANLQPYSQVSDMAFQSAYGFNLYYGSIGDGNMLKKPVSIFLNTLSKFTTQAPITFQGSGSNGNQSLVGGNDQYLHLVNLYNSVTSNIGLKFGTDDAAPLISRYGSRIGFNNEVYLGGGTLNLGSTNGNEETFVMSDGLFHFVNNYSQTDYTTGIAFGSAIGNPSIAVTNDRNTMKITAFNLQLPNNLTTSDFELGSQTSAKSTFIDFHTDGLSSTDYNSRIYASGNNLSLTASHIYMVGATSLQPLTTAQIKALSNPSAGDMFQDSTTNQPVIYENGAWYPMQLGSAL